MDHPQQALEMWRDKVVLNLHAHDDFMEHTIEVLDRELDKKAKTGDAITVWTLTGCAEGENTVKIRYGMSSSGLYWSVLCNPCLITPESLCIYAVFHGIRIKTGGTHRGERNAEGYHRM